MNLMYLKTQKRGMWAEQGRKKDSTTDKIGGGHLMVITLAFFLMCVKSLKRSFKQVYEKDLILTLKTCSHKQYAKKPPPSSYASRFG